MRTGVDSKRLAKGSSGRRETEMSFLSSSSPSALTVVSSFDRRPLGHVLACGCGMELCKDLLPTLLSLTGPPNEAMPFSTFLMMAGCSTTEMARDGIGSHDACWLSPFAVCVGCSSLMAHCNGFFCSRGTEYTRSLSCGCVCRVCASTAEALSSRAHTHRPWACEDLFAASL